MGIYCQVPHRLNSFGLYFLYGVSFHLVTRVLLIIVIAYEENSNDAIVERENSRLRRYARLFTS